MLWNLLTKECNLLEPVAISRLVMCTITMIGVAAGYL